VQDLKNAKYYSDAAVFIVDNYAAARDFQVRLDKSARDLKMSDELDRDSKMTGEQKEPQKGEFTLDQMVEMADRYAQNEEYYSAYYFASLVLNIDKTNLKAKSIADESLKKIKTLGLSLEDQKKRAYFQLKQKGYEKLASNGDEDQIDAYYIFMDLKSQNPTDPDVKKYLDISRDKVTRIRFFSDEVRDVPVLPGREGILFVNHNSDQAIEIVSIGKMVNIEDNYYFKDIEVLSFLKNGVLLYHYTSPFGKYIHVPGTGKEPSRNYINVQSIDRTNQAKNTGVKFLAGSIAKQNFNNLLEVKPDAIEMQYLTTEKMSVSRMGFNELISFSLAKPFSRPQPVEEFGFPKKEMDMEILLRCLNPFTFFILSLFSISAGWFFRSRYAIRPPIGTLIIIPFFPIAIHLVVTLYLLIFRTLFGFTLLTVGLETSLIIGGISQVLILMVAIVILAGQAVE
jgi:hypothetical protein